MSKSKAINYSAFDTAVYYITFKDRTVKELYDKLREKGYSSQDIDESIGKLQEYGYVNDDNYAFSYIKGNINKKGSRRISMELIRKGIDKEIIYDKLSMFDDNETKVIQEALERRYRNANFDDQSERRRIFSYFVRRGFKYENISRVMAKFGQKLKKSE